MKIYTRNTGLNARSILRADGTPHSRGWSGQVIHWTIGATNASDYLIEFTQGDIDLLMDDFRKMLETRAFNKNQE